MDDLISRTWLLAEYDKRHKGPPGGARKLIEEAPSAQSKKGKWVLVCDNNGMHFICNKCGAWRYHQEQNFCGECGADMRGEQDERDS